MSRLIDIPARAKAAGVEPFDWFEFHTLGEVKKDRGLGRWKGFNEEDEEEELGYGWDDWLDEDETEVDEEEEKE
ncbi:MAG: hypothetical protein Q9226_009393, partial [Calogaya cf. arnoldii]